MLSKTEAVVFLKTVRNQNLGLLHLNWRFSGAC